MAGVYKVLMYQTHFVLSVVKVQVYLTTVLSHMRPQALWELVWFSIDSQKGVVYL